jgi:hypothetical protein
MISGTMGTTYHGLRGKEQGGGSTMSWPTRLKDLSQVARIQGSYKIYIESILVNRASRDRV